MIADSIMFNDKKTYTNQDNILDDSTPDNEAIDSFIRILGIKATTPQIEQDGDYGVVTAKMFSTGLKAIFYDSEQGIRIATSRDGGEKWEESAIILAKDGTCGFMIDDLFFYYMSQTDGLKSKLLTYADIEQCAALSAKGNTPQDVELIQSGIDKRKTVILGTGIIPTQKFSGYVDNTGARKIFYYTKNNNLSCVMSTDESTWKIAPNF